MCRKYLRGVERGETPPWGVIFGKEGGRGERAFIGCSDRSYMLAANHPGHISFGTPSSESVAEFWFWFWFVVHAFNRSSGIHLRDPGPPWNKKTSP